MRKDSINSVFPLGASGSSGCNCDIECNESYETTADPFLSTICTGHGPVIVAGRQPPITDCLSCVPRRAASTRMSLLQEHEVLLNGSMIVREFFPASHKSMSLIRFFGRGFFPELQSIVHQSRNYALGTPWHGLSSGTQMIFKSAQLVVLKAMLNGPHTLRVESLLTSVIQMRSSHYEPTQQSRLLYTYYLPHSRVDYPIRR